MRNYFYIYVFCGLLFIISGINYVFTDYQVVNLENKVATPKPVICDNMNEIPLYRIIPHHVRELKKYCRKYEAFYNDNFFLKSYLIGLYNNLKNKFRANPKSTQVIIGEDEWLFLGNDYSNINEIVLGVDTFSKEELLVMKESQLKHKQYLDALGIDYIVMIAPEKTTIYPEKHPIQLKVNRTKSDQAVEILSELGIPTIFPKNELLEAKKNFQVYYKYDSHWNSNGAFIAYSMMMDSLKIKHPELRKLNKSDFIISNELKKGENDLSKIISLDSDWDYIPEYKLPSPTVLIGENKINNQEICRELRLYTVGGNSKKLLSFNDSYLPKSSIYLAESFKEYTMCQYIGEPKFDYQIIANENPNIVVYEVVERAINALLK